MANLLAFPGPPFPHAPIGENPKGGQPTVINRRAKGNWDNVEKVRRLAF